MFTLNVFTYTLLLLTEENLCLSVFIVSFKTNCYSECLTLIMYIPFHTSRHYKPVSVITYRIKINTIKSIKHIINVFFFILRNNLMGLNSLVHCIILRGRFMMIIYHKQQRWINYQQKGLIRD